ncbi:uncharacterized protein K460DRAFT_355913 [Cucurbitaria berberidis CBS 394.84]|uniref:Uncharacterized protein n=1 Tax=Cucurbitaria berberidis CBS 394.84 TaxID=1168544 RepID=A0A9P4L9A1_9PLEO|nr:uncharacterized protein K460DRAFT_355913 [Cucurbitaria berberidis CBS 394.84]KAF1846203.1 hypothetical protein K460DRAFT_355913 [Cucurbitaria berberidis CBS 394.84]
MASTIASPVPLRFDQSQHMGNDVHSAEPGRDTPLPQYEKTQSVPFTLNLQEDARNPGQFQLVVNISPKHQTATGLPLNLATPHNLHTPKNEVSKPILNAQTLYQTQKSSPPTTPLQDKQGWSDLDAVPSEFLQKVVPDWNVTFSRSDSTASTQSKRLADIKAKIKKKGKGYVVRLLKGSTGDPSNEIEVDLGQQHTAAETTISTSHELDSSDLRAELDSTQTIIPSTDDSVIGRPDVYEIGTSNEPGMQQWQSPAIPSRFPIGTSSRRHTAVDVLSAGSIAEESLSDAETLIPDVQSISGRIDEDQTDTEFSPRTSVVQPTRSDSVFSIVKTPTRGLSVVGPVRRVEKTNRARTKSKTTHLELNRSDAHKSVKRRSPRNSTSNFATGVSFAEAHVDSSTLRERVRPIARRSPEQDLAPAEYSTWQHPTRNVKVVKPGHSRRLSVDDLQVLGTKGNLRLQTNIPRPKSTNVSPVVRRKKSPRTHQPVLSSRSSDDSIDNTEQPNSSPEWSEVDPSVELREALGRAFTSAVDIADDVEESFEEISIPRIVEPVDESQIGEIPFPSEVEIRSAPISVRSPTLKFWGLAISALSEKAYKGLKVLGDLYGTEPPVPPGHVRVRWTCSCGEPLYDDFIETRPNAARLLEAYLNRPRTHTPRSPTSQSSSASSMASIFDASSRASTLATPSSTYGSPSPWGKHLDSSKYSPTRLRTNSPFSVRMPTRAEEAWLLTCANEGRLTPKIVHLDVNDVRIKSDKDLALALREHYDQLNRRWFNWARLRGLTTIEFVQFEVHRNRFADIRATPSMPPNSASPPASTPDPEKPQAPSRHPYTFEPIDLLPPVGSTYLLHLFKHPNDYDGELVTYLRSPKRRERLGFGMGWGINLVEGFLAQRVWMVVMGICGLGSVAFAVMWTVKKNDVQGAFGVAQWVLGFAVLLVGGIQAWLE